MRCGLDRIMCIAVAAVAAVAPCIADLQDGLVAHYKLDGNAMEMSGNGSDGTVNGAIPTNDRNGTPSGAMQFDGVDDWVEVPHGANLEIVNNAIWTVATWFRTSKTTHQHIVDKYNAFDLSESGTDGWGVDLTFDGRINVRLNSGGGCGPCTNSFNLHAGSGFNDGLWHHVTVVFVGTAIDRLDAMEVWVDGTRLTNTDPVNNPWAPNQDYGHTDPVLIGRPVPGEAGNPAHWFAGDIDDVRIYDRRLEDAEISLLACTPTAAVAASRTGAAPGSQVTACVSFDLTACSSAALGSYAATLDWDPAVLDYVGSTGGSAPFDLPVLNQDDIATGSLAFGDAEPSGASGEIKVLCSEFDVIGVGGATTTLDLQLTSAFTATEFLDISGADVTDDNFIALACTIGDVNGDGVVNSGDALIVLANEIELPIPGSAVQRIAAGCGDADGNGATDSIDSNVILSSEIGLALGPGFPIGTSNQYIDSCATTAKRAELDKSRSRQFRADAGRARSPVEAGLTIDRKRVRVGETIEVTAVVHTPPGIALGSYGATIEWDPANFELLDVATSTVGMFARPLINARQAASGRARFSAADVHGKTGRVELVKIRLVAKRPVAGASTAFSLNFSSIGAPGPAFEDLENRLRVRGSSEVHAFGQRSLK